LTRARARVESIEYQLAVLLGMTPGREMPVLERQLPEPPALPVTGVPADLFSHRPDVRAAWLRLKAADARAAAAVLDVLPSMQLSGNLFSTAREIGKLFEEWLWSLSGNLSQSIFQGGRILAGMRQADATAEAQYYTYINTALTALREVRDALVMIRAQERYLESLREQAEDAQTVLDLSRERYAQGALPYLQVLTAIQSLQQTQQNLVEAQRQLLSNHIQLYRALGGRFADYPDSRNEEKDTSDG
jgi:outer membrane protein TolC